MFFVRFPVVPSCFEFPFPNSDIRLSFFFLLLFSFVYCHVLIHQGFKMFHLTLISQSNIRVMPTQIEQFVKVK